MRTLQELNKLTYVVQHNPNCPSPFLVRLIGKSAVIDMLPYDETKDVLGFGKTLVKAAQEALCVKREFERVTTSEWRNLGLIKKLR